MHMAQKPCRSDAVAGIVIGLGPTGHSSTEGWETYLCSLDSVKHIR